jgi:hypothetical protein
MSEDKLTPVPTPGSGISPKSHPTSKPQDYFTTDQMLQNETSTTSTTSTISSDASSDHGPGSNHPAFTEAGVPVHMVLDAVDKIGGKANEKEVENDSDASATTPGEVPSPGSTSEPPSRKTSFSSVTFRHPRNPALPQGMKKPHGGSRIREASPPHRR